MKIFESNKFLVLAGFAFCVVGVSAGSPCACAPEPTPVTKTSQNGGFAFAGNGNGANFDWSRYVPPIIKIVTNGTSTAVTTTPGFYNGTENKKPNKFVFNYNMGLGSSRQPDLQELQDVLISENFLPINTNKTVYDATIRNAVADFQRVHGIRPAPKYPYGYFGPLTRGYINNR